MTSERALIVDDSKTAQHLLKRMLEKFDLQIDVVSSAEEALAFLSYNHPSVIFLDHHMTGMSGMDALRTIKANPGTALIPVIMYTSEKNDLFVGQAIALGALDILSKSTMQPSTLERVLKNLNIGERHSEKAEVDITVDIKPEVKATIPIPAPAIMPPPVAPVSQPALMSDLQQVRTQIGKLFEIHIAEVRNQINSSTQFIVKRMSISAESKSQRNSRATDSIAHAEENSKSIFISRLFLSAIVVLVCIAIFLLLQIKGDLQYASKNLQGAIDSEKEDTHLLAKTVNQFATNKPNDGSQTNTAVLLHAISFVQNADFQFNYNEPPLNTLQLSNLSALVATLTDAGYAGPLVINVHFGNLCLEPDSLANSWRLARYDMPATSCKMLKDLNQKFTLADLNTPAYQAFLQAAPAIQSGRINVQLKFSGFNSPRSEYPIIRSNTTASEWNRTALKNHRISIEFQN